MLSFPKRFGLEEALLEPCSFVFLYRDGTKKKMIRFAHSRGASGYWELKMMGIVGCDKCGSLPTCTM